MLNEQFARFPIRRIPLVCFLVGVLTGSIFIPSPLLRSQSRLALANSVKISTRVHQVELFETNHLKKKQSAVLHYCGGDTYAGIANLSLLNTREYAYSQGLEVLVANSSSLPTEPFFTPKAWLKLAFMLQIFQQYHHDWLIWLDCDVLVTKLNTTLEQTLGGLNVSTLHDIVVAKDIGTSPFNTGVMFVRANQWSKDTVARALRYASEKAVREHAFWEQKALHLLYTENKHQEQEKILIVEDRWRMNAFASLNEERPESFAWHRVNCRKKDVCDKTFKNKFCQIHPLSCAPGWVW